MNAFSTGLVGAETQPRVDCVYYSEKGKNKIKIRLKTNQPMKYVQMFHLVQMPFYAPVIAKRPAVKIGRGITIDYH